MTVGAPPAVADLRRWRILAVLCVAYFMTIVDISIVNVALPSIGRSLHFSRANLQWVATGYAIAYSSFLLLGGRAADHLGRRRVFAAGVVLFTLASLACGLASNDGMLIAFRVVQGFGACVIYPSALSILSLTFVEGAERNRAFALWGAVGGLGAVIGVVAGGILTTYLSWRWIFFVNLPVGAAVLAGIRTLLAPSPRTEGGRRYDALGGGAVAATLALLIYGLSRVARTGWDSAETIGVLAGAAACAVLFVVVEARVPEPLLPLRFFRVRARAIANLVGVLYTAAIFGHFFLLTLYLQQVLGYSALQAGSTFVVIAVTGIAAAAPAQMLTTRLGPKPVLASGLVLLMLAMAWYLRLPVHGSFAPDLLPAYVLAGAGFTMTGIPVSLTALSATGPAEAGLAAGVIATSQQVGAAIGIAAASTIYVSRAVHLGGGASAVVHGFHWAFAGLGLFAFAGLVVTLVLLPARRPTPKAAAVSAGSG